MQPNNKQSELTEDTQQQLSASDRALATESGSTTGTSEETRTNKHIEAPHAKVSRSKRVASRDLSPAQDKKKSKAHHVAAAQAIHSSLSSDSANESLPISPSLDSNSVDASVSVSTSLPASSKGRQPVIMPAGLPNPMPGQNVIRDDPALISRLSLNMTQQEGVDFRKQNVPSYSFPVLPKEDRIPKEHVFALETGTNPRVEQWIKDRLSVNGKAENRVADRREVQYIRPDEWQYIVEADQNAEIKDHDTGEICLYVIRDFVGDNDVLEYMNKVSKPHGELVIDVRKEDSSTMSPFAYSAGSKSRPEFMPCRNLESARKWTDQERKLHNHRLHSAETMIWNMTQKKLPSTIIDPMIVEMGKNNMPRADWSSMGDKEFRPIVSVESGGRSHEITGLECGPPNAVCASMYSRACHHEKAPEKAPFVISLSTECTPGGIGGNFYIQGHGVLIKNTKNSLIVHRANSLHGTTVHDIDHAAEEDSSRAHRGFSVFINPKMEMDGLWQQHLNVINNIAVYDSKGRLTYSAEQEAALSPNARRKHINKIKAREYRDKKEEGG